MKITIKHKDTVVVIIEQGKDTSIRYSYETIIKLIEQAVVEMKKLQEPNNP